MTIAISEKRLKNLIRENVKKALVTEMIKLRALAMPEISQAEQGDIERRYGKKPSRKRSRSYFLVV